MNLIMLADPTYESSTIREKQILKGMMTKCYLIEDIDV